MCTFVVMTILMPKNRKAVLLNRVNEIFARVTEFSVAKFFDPFVSLLLPNR